MIGALLGRFKLPLIIGVVSALGMAALWFRGEHYANNAEEYRIERNEAAKRANDLADTMKENERQFQLQLEDIRSQRDTLLEMNETLAAAGRRDRETKSEIYDAPEEDDGPIAPVLRRTIERLRGEPTGADTPAED